MTSTEDAKTRKIHNITAWWHVNRSNQTFREMDSYKVVNAQVHLYKGDELVNILGNFSLITIETKEVPSSDA
jgi:hypothetical protein